MGFLGFGREILIRSVFVFCVCICVYVCMHMCVHVCVCVTLSLSSERGHIGLAQASRPRGRTWNLITQGETKARRRVFYFLAVFAITGFFSE